jgi:cytochrome bd-type quinol oxidase subunit 1
VFFISIVLGSSFIITALILLRKKPNDEFSKAVSDMFIKLAVVIFAIAHAPFEGVKMGRCLGLYFFGCGDIANMSQPSGDTAA